MSQPPVYSRQSDFTSYQTNNPGQPMSGSDLDNEFNSVKTTLDAIRSNMAIIQRDDTQLMNAIVHPDALNTATLALLSDGAWAPKGAWATATVYAVGDIVEQVATSYVCAVAHTSGTFATDHAAGKWVVLGYSQSVGQSGSSVFAVAGGTADVITAAFTPSVESLGDGQELRVRSVGANTVSGVTINVDSIGAKTIKRLGNQSLLVGDIPRSDYEMQLRYNGTNDVFELLNPAVPMTAFSRGLIDDADSNAAKDTLRLQVDGMSALQALAPVSGERIWLNYHTSDGDGGHGIFRGVTGAAAGTYIDNSGTIIVPTGGDGSSAWIREYDGAASVQFWGADKTGASDCSTTITSALSSGIKRLEFDPDGIYKLTSSVTIPSDVELYGNGATIDVAYDGDGFYIANGWTLGTSATVTSTHTNNSTFATTNTVATVTSTTGYAAGDLVSVRGGGTYPQSFFARIESLTSTDITLDDYLLYTLTTPTLYKVTLQNIVIDGFVMYYSVGSVSGTSYLIECTGSGVEIRNCRFGNAGSISRCITCIGAFVDIHDNYFDDVALCIQYFDNAHSTVRNNDFSNFATAIRGVRMDSCAIVENRIINGTNASYGLGIEITAESVSYDKNCRNLVEGNTVINANKGIAGSGIGGIHLNYSAKLNRIINNTCRHNSFGIYLENDCDYNLIEGNVCSDQDGYYGVGIELDFNSSNNIISNNVCENNRGSLTAAESTGIQVRDSGANPCNYNVVIGNTCRNNGLDGIRCGGKWTTVTGNTLEGNGIDVEAFNGADATLLGWGIRVLGPDASITNNFIHQNAYDSRATSSFTQVAIDINGVTNAIVQGNTIVGGYYSNRSISVSNSSDNVLIANNSITCDGATGRAIEVLSSTDVYVNTNLISQSANGQPAISVNTLDKFSIWGNVFTGAVSTLSLTAATNRYTLGDNV